MFTIAKTALRPATARYSVIAAAYRSKHTLPNLPYDYNALEPFISEEIMKLHHQKHHQTYVNGLNAAEESYASAQSTKEQIKLQSALKFNGGGHINHSLFWKNLAPASGDGGKLPDGPLKQAIERDFGSVEEFKKRFNTTTAAVQGSGWGWLGFNPTTEKLEVTTTPNQDPLITHAPIIGVDIWEHAFYLQYKNVKPDYLNAIWNVINFKEAETRFLEASA
ncbi:manganese superoxide dismutase [Pleurotus eryngii]|uniref:Superoxide dismutase n=1 Tax=Pleurotus eryngii TaxID=5323 RepID=A0A9P5ZXI3_PLEER|nr:manganese superoxide dismutase [Pleurotus eryngii]